MNTWFTADLHLDHKNICKYQPLTRSFDNVDDMNMTLISNWNQRVKPGDVVWVIGDVFFCNAEKAAAFLGQLNGTINLIPGNHDDIIMDNKRLQGMFNQVYPGLHEINMHGIHVVMCHYPLASWNKQRKGAFMLHGHSHGMTPDFPGRLDVGVDCHNLAPISWNQVCKIINASREPDHENP